MADQDKEGIPEDAQETIKADAPEKKTAPKPKTKAKTKTKTTARTKTKTAAKTKAKTKTQAKTKAKTKTKTKAKTKTKTKTKTKATPKTKTAAAKKAAEKPPAAPPPEPPKEPPTEVSTPPGDDGSKKQLIFGGAVGAVGVLLILALIIVLAFNSGLVGGGGGGKNIIIGFPDNDGNYDVYLVKPGEDEDDGVRIAKDVDLGGSAFYVIEDNEVTGFIEGLGFIPNTSQVLFSYVDDGETILEQMRVRDDETSDLFDSEDWFQVGVYPDKDLMVIFEYRDEGARCYVANFGEEADRIDKGTDCWPSYDGRTMMVIDEDDDETAFTLHDLRRESDEEVLKAEDVAAYAISPDMSMIAYVVNSSDDEQELHLYDIDKEEDEDIEEDYAIPDFDFTMAGELYYVVQDDDGNMEAFVHGGDGAFAEGEVMSITPSPEGDYLIIVSGEDEEDLEVYSYLMRKGEAEEIHDGEYLEVAIASDPLQLFISEFADGDLTIYTGDMDGRKLDEIYDESDVIYFDIWTVTGHEYFYLEVETEDGATLFACRAGDDECSPLLEEWYSFTLLNISANGRYLVLAAVEDSGDDQILYSVRLGSDPEVVELDDDAEGIINAVFAANDRDVLYTAINGDDPDEISINSVPVSGNDKPEELHDEAQLFAVEWGNFSPFDVLSFSWLNYGY
jgi:hypothetical protein